MSRDGHPGGLAGRADVCVVFAGYRESGDIHLTLSDISKVTEDG